MTHVSIRYATELNCGISDNVQCSCSMCSMCPHTILTYVTCHNIINIYINIDIKFFNFILTSHLADVLYCFRRYKIQGYNIQYMFSRYKRSR